MNLSKPPNRNESGVLALLWRKILKENNFMSAIGMLTSRYMKDQDAKAEKNRNLKKKNKSTLLANVTAREMTIKTFMDLVFNYLKARRLDITIKVTFANGKESTHSVSVDGSHFHEGTEDEEEIVDDTQS